MQLKIVLFLAAGVNLAVAQIRCNSYTHAQPSAEKARAESVVADPTCTSGVPDRCHGTCVCSCRPVRLAKEDIEEDAKAVLLEIDV
ncbi:hypothetical protein H2199_005474 [Coniosporium tulheliwenetii]|uniref:Uncharacterized protein n=1 Tax=Coniosporium tulheliwenetii TaxID=3383036 RepID=A0ACC2Z1M9_9PEZI|nr:hypothetical protein H2199_005474 [Cladosporium sp. JES 115]